MPISSSDIQFRYSVKTGSTGNTTPGNAAGSLGKYLSTTNIEDASLHALFPELTGDENAASNQDYSCLFVLNNHPTLTLQRTVIWVVSEVAGGAEMYLALDNIGIKPKGSSTVQASSTANKNTVPTSTTAFEKPTTKATGLVIGDVAPGSAIAVWIRRTAKNSPAQLNDGATLRIDGDTAA